MYEHGTIYGIVVHISFAAAVCSSLVLGDTVMYGCWLNVGPPSATSAKHWCRYHVLLVGKTWHT